MVDRQFTKDGVLHKILRCVACGRQHVYATEETFKYKMTIQAESETDAAAMALYLCGEGAEVTNVTKCDDGQKQ